MSVTILGLAVAALGEGARILHQAGWKPGQLLKEAKPMIVDAEKKLLDYQNAAGLNGWTVENKNTKTKLSRTYNLKGKTIWGVNQTVVRYFKTLHDVTVNETSVNGSSIVTCKAKLPRKAAGLKLDLTVTLTQIGNTVSVDYESPTNEVIETVKGLGLSFFVIGAGKLWGQAIRHDIPIELDRVIREYLN